MARPALLLGVAVCVVLAGCPVLGPDHTREERAEERLAAATDAVAATESYRFETEMTVVATADDRTETVAVDLTGAVNATERRMRANATRDGETRQSVTLNRTVYQECGDPWDGWGVEELESDGEDDWASHTPAVRQLSLLESGSLYWNGTETLDGREVVVLRGEPTTEALTRYSERRRRSLFGGPNVEDAEVTVWLDAETDRPRKTHVRFEVSGDGGSATAELTSRFRGHRDPVSISPAPRYAEDTYDLGCPG